MTQNVEAWISPQTGDDAPTARDRVAARLTGRPDPVAEKERQNALEQQVAELWERVPERTRTLTASGVPYDEAKQRAEREAREAEQKLRGTTPPSNEYLGR